ncbi:hypothetical protein RHA1_ro10261 (plasmid) [Rhodococcus jostii RHA1]|uniref:Uncharacterized protein n=1 Tax=Rhodococcus jostii (strain RHA1) TaxID=101510 RepID=Q0RW82_RHOJR|nr:hypothetical protein RHA1_ro10261 [Rhodococcus jostii RHA1]
MQVQRLNELLLSAKRSPRARGVQRRPSGRDKTRRSFRRSSAGLEASVEDADEPVGQPPQNRTVIKTAVAQFAVVSAGTGKSATPRTPVSSAHRRADRPRPNRPTTTFFLPEAEVIGLVPAWS